MKFLRITCGVLGGFEIEPYEGTRAEGRADLLRVDGVMDRIPLMILLCNNGLDLAR